MIVTCEQCATQFQLDDSKVPEGGIRVRCSRCKFAFFVESPNAPDAERAEALARDALEQERPADLARDALERERPADLARDALEQERPADLADRDQEDFGLEDESDWQFNEDSQSERFREQDADDLAAAQEAVDDLLGGSLSGSGVSESADPFAHLDTGGDLDISGLDIDDPDAPVPSLGDPEPDASLEADDDPSAMTVHRDVAAEGDADSAAHESILAASAAPDLDLAPPLDADAEADADAGVDAGADYVDPFSDLGSPEDWDLGTEAVASGSPSTRIARISRPVLEEAEQFSESLEPDRFEADAFAFDAEPEESAAAVWMARARNSLGWVIVCALCAYAGVVGLWPRLVISQPELTKQTVAGLVVDGIRGRWIENAVAGPIYVVTGALRGGSANRLASGSLLRIRLLDRFGAPIASESAAVGPPLPAAQVRESNLRDLRDIQEAGALRMARKSLVAGERRPFLAVLGRVPPSAVAFDFLVERATSPATGFEAGGEIPYPFAEPAAVATDE